MADQRCDGDDERGGDAFPFPKRLHINDGALVALSREAATATQTAELSTWSTTAIANENATPISTNHFATPYIRTCHSALAQSRTRRFLSRNTEY